MFGKELYGIHVYIHICLQVQALSRALGPEGRVFWFRSASEGIKVRVPLCEVCVSKQTATL